KTMLLVDRRLYSY
ncbi:hypothetical protein D043_3088C, partial [Vibrio parahaemolyticus EKP-021]